MRKVFEENEELRELEQKLKMAQVNKQRRNQLEEKRQLMSEELVQDFEEDAKLMRKLNQEVEQDLLKQKEERKRLFENEIKVRKQIVEKEWAEQQQKQEEKYKDKEQIDSIVQDIINQELSQREKIQESKKQQLNNMVDSLWLKNQNLKREKEKEQLEYQKAVDFQRILDNREKEKHQKQQAASEFKDKV